MSLDEGRVGSACASTCTAEGVEIDPLRDLAWVLRAR